MPTGSDGPFDEELLLEELEPLAESGAGLPEGLPPLPEEATLSSADEPAFDEAGVEDARADSALYAAETALAPDGARRAALWLEIERLAE
ncbi:MAG TPA: hypothetical protein VHK47_20810, partial [Polyangia bacterium]|nr:hypothetical protein [Polyangia bacterium]